MIYLMLALISAGLLPSCETVSVEKETRNRDIATEPLGNYYIGRRVAVQRTRFWGYLRQPRQPWEKAQLVIMNEKEKLAPDRLSEDPVSGPGFQFDHNYEYKITGYYTGRKAYDPNSDKILPEFMLQSHQLISERPGFLFNPKEKKDVYGIPVPRR
jgi:hypothetical protein